MNNNEYMIEIIQQIKGFINDNIGEINGSIVDRIIECWRCNEEVIFQNKLEDVMNDLKLCMIKMDELEQIIISYDALKRQM